MDAAVFAAKQAEEREGGTTARGGPFFQLVYNEQHEPAAAVVRCPGLARRHHAAAGLSAGPRPSGARRPTPTRYP